MAVGHTMPPFGGRRHHAVYRPDPWAVDLKDVTLKAAEGKPGRRHRLRQVLSRPVSRLPDHLSAIFMGLKAINTSEEEVGRGSRRTGRLPPMDQELLDRKSATC